jgi:hypothetical protein
MSDSERLENILELIDRVHRYASPQTGRGPYDQNELVRTWVLHHILLIGEAVDRLSKAAAGLERRRPTILRLTAHYAVRVPRAYAPRQEPLQSAGAGPEGFLPQLSRRCRRRPDRSRVPADFACP